MAFVEFGDQGSPLDNSQRKAALEVIHKAKRPLLRHNGGVNIEKITVRVTSTGQTMEVVVLSKRASGITVVLGEGVHNVKCELSPTRNGRAYAGTVMGREIVYERSQEQVQADIDRLDPRLKKSR